MSRCVVGVLLALGAAGIQPSSAPAQDPASSGQDEGRTRDIVSNQISVSSGEAMLELEFADGEVMEIGLRDGAAIVDAETVGSFDPGGTLDNDWRALLGSVTVLSNGPLAQALIDWSPAPEVQGSGADVADSLDEVLEDRLRTAEGAPAQDSPAAPPVTADSGAPGTMDSRIDLDSLEARIRSRVRMELRDEVREEVRDELRDGFRGRTSTFPTSRSPLRSVWNGLGGIIQTIVTFSILLGLGMVVIHFFPGNFQRISDVAAAAPGKSALVGLAGMFLLIPAYVLGILALAVSIIGIPLILAWLPLFPIAAGLAAGLGYLALAHVAGTFVVGKKLPPLDFLRSSNTVHTLTAGLGILMVPFLAANVVRMGGAWLGLFQTLFIAVGTLAGIVAVTIGFGAVLLTRAGRTPPYAPGSPGAPEPGGWPPHAGDPGPAMDDDGGWDREWEDLEREARRERRRPPEPGTSSEGPPDGKDETDADAGGPRSRDRGDQSGGADPGQGATGA